MARWFISLSAILTLAYVGTFAENVHYHTAEAILQQLEEDNALCDLCVISLKRIDTFLHEDTSKYVINKTLYGICNMTTGDIRSECFNAVSMLEEIFKGHLDAKGTCQAIMVCPKSDSLGANPQAGKVQKDKPFDRVKRGIKDLLRPKLGSRLLNGGLFKFKDGLLCDACKKAVNVTENSLTPLKAMIIKSADEICGYLPDPTKEACTDTINHYVPLWWKEAMDVATPEFVCSLVRVCSSSSKPLEKFLASLKD